MSFFPEKPIEEKRKSQWSWVFFEKTIELSEEMQSKLQNGHQVELVLTSKAFNAAWNVQPDQVNYNAHGCCVNHLYKVPVTLSSKVPENVKDLSGEFLNKPSGGKFAKPFRHFDPPTTSVKV